jgi:hypothetical protein
MLADEGKENLLTTVGAVDFQNVEELLNDVGAGTDSELARTLEWAIFLPFFDAPTTK